MIPGFGRILSTLLAVWLAATLAFLALRVVPGNAVEAQLVQSGASSTAIAERRDLLGLDDPVLIQYLNYMKDLLHGNLGYSLLDGFPVTDLILRYIASTAALASGALLVAVGLGLSLGILSAIDASWGISSTAHLLVNLALATPIYWTGTLAILGVLLLVNRFPDAGIGYMNQMLLPVLVLGFHTSGAVARVVHTNIQTTLGLDFVRTARSKGLTERRVIWHHVLRAGLPPVITVIGLQAGFLFGGTVITEALFVRPGLGQLLLTRTIQQDYPVVQGIVVVAALVYTLFNTLAETAYRLLDPRVTS